MKTLKEIKHERIKKYANSLRNTLQWTLAALIVTEDQSGVTKSAIRAARKELTRITPEKLNK